MTSASSTSAAVHCRGVTKTYGTGNAAVVALRGIDLDVAPGQLMMLVGPSGCGKTTLISVIAGILDQNDGQCLLFGHDLKAMAPARVLLTSAANGGAVLCFIIAGAVRWPETLAMLAASVIGGYLGARLTRVLPPAIVRRFVIALTALVTLVFFLRMI